MNPEVVSSYPQMQELHVAEVVSYLQQNHWMLVSHPSPRLLVFEKGVDDQGKPIHRLFCQAKTIMKIRPIC
jgi:hypothetical protein